MCLGNECRIRKIANVFIATIFFRHPPRWLSEDGELHFLISVKISLKSNLSLLSCQLNYP